MMKRGHFWVSGRVQGVCFRMYTSQQARGLGLTGWVKNLSDGRVEVVIEGEESAIDNLLKWCAHGPSCANVTNVRSQFLPPTGEFDSFRVVY